jgi:hypothetical protein
VRHVDSFSKLSINCQTDSEERTFGKIKRASLEIRMRDMMAIGIKVITSWTG